MLSAALFHQLAQYNKRMNEKTYEICAEIPDAIRKKDTGAFFKSIHGTLNHLLFGDLSWLNRLAGRNYDLPAVGTDLCDDFDNLRQLREETDAFLCNWTQSLTDDWLATVMEWTSGIDNVKRRQPHWLLTLHLFNHQTHHRGQLTTLLTQHGYDVGVTDLVRVVDTVD